MANTQAPNEGQNIIPEGIPLQDTKDIKLMKLYTGKEVKQKLKEAQKDAYLKGKIAGLKQAPVQQLQMQPQQAPAAAVAAPQLPPQVIINNERQHEDVEEVVAKEGSGMIKGALKWGLILGAPLAIGSYGVGNTLNRVGDGMAEVGKIPNWGAKLAVGTGLLSAGAVLGSKLTSSPKKKTKK